MELVTLTLGVAAGVVARWQMSRRNEKRANLLRELSVPQDQIVLQIEQKKTQHLQERLFSAEAKLNQLQAEKLEVARLKEALTLAEEQAGQFQIDKRDVQQLTEKLVLAEAQVEQFQAEKQNVDALKEKLALAEIQLRQLQSLQSIPPADLAAPIETILLDRLELIQGIEPRFARYLNQAGILTYSDLAQSSTESLQTILTTNGEASQSIDISTNRWIADARIRMNRLS